MAQTSAPIQSQPGRGMVAIPTERVLLDIQFTALKNTETIESGNGK